MGVSAVLRALADGLGNTFTRTESNTAANERLLEVLSTQAVVDALLAEIRRSDPEFECFAPTPTTP